MPPQPSTRQPSSRPERARLIDALVLIAGARGLDAASPGRVARRAGLPLAAFFRNFDSIEECWLAAYEDALDRLAQTVEDAVSPCTSSAGVEAWEAQLDGGFRAVLEFLAARPELARACVVESTALGQPAIAARERAIALFVRYLEGLRAATDAPVPPLAAEVIVRGTHELIYARVASGQAERLPELLPDLRYCWLTPFVGRFGATGARGGREYRP
jgi:AcrR family transcriptional regulator